MADDLVVREWRFFQGKIYAGKVELSPGAAVIDYNDLRVQLATMTEKRDALGEDLYVCRGALKESEEALAAMTAERDALRKRKNYYKNCNQRNIDVWSAQLAAMTAERNEANRKWMRSMAVMNEKLAVSEAARGAIIDEIEKGKTDAKR
jgi:hypothetical protein